MLAWLISAQIFLSSYLFIINRLFVSDNQASLHHQCTVRAWCSCGTHTVRASSCASFACRLRVSSFLRTFVLRDWFAYRVYLACCACSRVVFMVSWCSRRNRVTRCGARCFACVARCSTRGGVLIRASFALVARAVSCVVSVLCRACPRVVLHVVVLLWAL